MNHSEFKFSFNYRGFIAKSEKGCYHQGLSKYTDDKSQFIDVFLVGLYFYFSLTSELFKLITQFLKENKDKLDGYR